MGIHLEHSSSGFGAFYIEPGELPETEWPVTEAAPGPAPAPVEAPAPAPSTWLEDLPPAHFGPTAPSVIEPPVSSQLAALPAVPVPVPTDPTPAPPPATETEQTANQPREDDPGDRTSDFDLIAHHERFIARGEAAWAAMSEAYQRARDAEAERPHSGDDTYARERAVEYQQMMLRDEEERQASEALATAAGADAESDNQSAAESERLARQNQTLVVAATSPSAWAGGPDRAVWAQPATTAFRDETSTPNAPTTQVVIIEGRRPPPGVAMDVTLPAGVEDAEDITRAGTPTQLLTGSAATAALTSLGVLAIDAETTAMSAAGRAVLYLGERVVGYSVPGGQVLLAASTAYALIHSGTQQAPGAAFVNADGLVQRYAPADDGGLVLQTQAPQQYELPNSPEEDHSWVTVGRVTPMTDEQRAQMLRPMTTPAQPQGPTVLPQPTSGDRSEPLPGYATDPGGQRPTVTTTPSAPQLNWEDLVIEASNSEQLGANLRAAGRLPPLDENGIELAGYDPHHILTSKKWPEFDYLRQQFAEWGIDLNSAANGVWLPGSQSPADATGSYHERVHNTEYRNAIEEAFFGVTTKEAALATLNDIRAQLEAGTFPGSRPRGQ